MSLISHIHIRYPIHKPSYRTRPSTSRHQKSYSHYTICLDTPIPTVAMHFFTTILPIVALLSQTAQAIRAVKNSPCEAKCGDISNTTASDIVCTDADYGTPTGQIFAECITCQLNSTTLDPETGESDLKWLLYNLRYAMSTCLWGIPNNKYVQNTVCIPHSNLERETDKTSRA